ncbi:DNA replication complex GINS protein PSF3 [Clonorchis sinensis]|uniref:DNA replication complex GINS protein PSF3 n=1 Tax=Clonorchis sinensis TaxID=79923 RepID=A0A8T1M226_CLOSI|nr:DNA replication complex GINS protein PSF3 [Clonorchis sinensis]
MSSSFVDFDWTLSLVHAGAYLNIDDILASSERTTCRLRVSLPGLAPLLLSDSTNVSFGQQRSQDTALVEESSVQVQTDVPAGSKLELPVWLALALGSGRRQLASIDLPLIYKDAFTEVFDADPCVVDLRRKAPLYYLLMYNLLGVGSAQAGRMAATAARVFQIRLKSVMDAALNASRQDTLHSTGKFDNLEMALFRVGQSERLQLERWTLRHHHKIEPSAFLKSVVARSQAKKAKVLTESNVDAN